VGPRIDLDDGEEKILDRNGTLNCDGKEQGELTILNLK
jgi:hypothetical protein